MPCRDEENTVGCCVDEAFVYLTDRNMNGEVIVVDNCSADESARVALDHGARLIEETGRGYGNAIRCGLNEAAGEYIIIVDCDMTYDLSDIDSIIKLLDEGSDLVIGDRFLGSIEKGAMPYLNRVGGKILSAIARRRFHVKINDFHCGIRGIRHESLQRMSLRTEGMEFATEMIAQAKEAGLTISQTPVSLKRCPVHRHSKLRIFRDGARHLVYIIRKT